MNECIFCKIVKKEIKADFLYEDDLVVAFKDIHPLAPIHILVIPRQHIEKISDLKDTDELLAGRLIIVAKNLAKQLGIAQRGYKLLFRVGHHGGQEVPHIHLHLIGGVPLTEGIGPIK